MSSSKLRVEWIQADIEPPIEIACRLDPDQQIDDRRARVHTMRAQVARSGRVLRFELDGALLDDPWHTEADLHSEDRRLGELKMTMRKIAGAAKGKADLGIRKGGAA